MAKLKRDQRATSPKKATALAPRQTAASGSSAAAPRPVSCGLPLNLSAIFPRHGLYMTITFDACIMINDHHLATAGLTGRRAEAVAPVRTAVQGMDGAGWIDVEAQYFPPHQAPWVVLYECCRSNTPDTPAWQTLQRMAEEVATAALPPLAFW
jgi:hypothetical protein